MAKRAKANCMQRLTALLLVTLTSLGVSSCVLVDKFGDRAVEYNIQAETTTNKDILLNIVRSAYERPMKFTDFTTVTGIATATATAAFSLPFGVNSIAAYGATPSASLSGGPNFTIVDLNTQEFYSGILRPVDMKTIALYIKKGYPKIFVFTLLIDEIVPIVSDESGKNIDNKPIYNNISNLNGGRQYTAYEQNLAALLSAGLDVEQVEKRTLVGPPLSDDDARNLRGLSDITQQGLTIVKCTIATTGLKPVEWSCSPREAPRTLSADELRSLEPATTHFYQVEKVEPVFRFCFNDSHKTKIDNTMDDAYIDPSEHPTIDERLKGYTIPDGARCGARQPTEGSTPPAAISASVALSEVGCRTTADVANELGKGLTVYQFIAPSQNSKHDDRNVSKDESGCKIKQILLQQRSVVDIFYYLGEIARSELAMRGGVSFVPTLWHNGKHGALFNVVRGSILDSALDNDSTLVSVTFGNNHYVIPASDVSGDSSGTVLEVLAELIALNKSAKDLPAPSVIPIVR